MPLLSHGRGGRAAELGADLDRIPLAGAAVRIVRNPLTPPFRAGSVTVACVWDVFVTVTSVEGETGLAYVSAFSEANAELLTSTARLLLVGADEGISNLGVLRRRMHALRRADDVGVGTLVETAFGALSMAVVDLAARSASVPVYELLGTPGSAAIYLSGGSLDAGPSELRHLVRHGARLGANIVKIKIDGNDEPTASSRVRAASSALQEGQSLAVDANQTFIPSGAASFLATLLDPERIAWIEEPVSAADIAGMLWLGQRTQVPITAGESVFGAEQVRGLLQSRAADRMILSLPRVGGVESFLALGALAKRLETPIASHVYPHVAAHLIPAAWSGALVEYLPWWDRHFEADAFLLADGRLSATDTRPGFGFSGELVRRLTGKDPG
jgi:mandelate racemase